MMKKKLFCLTLLALLCLCLAACAETAVSGDAYSELLTTWKTALSAGEALDDTVNPACLYNYTEVAPAKAIGYAIVDLDGDGVGELVIGETAETAYLPKILYDVYTLRDGSPASVLRGWERNRYYLCADGSIANEASDGAGSSAASVYSYAGDTLTFRYGIVYDASVASPWHWTSSSEEALTDANALTEADAQSKLDALTEQYQQLELTAFVDADL